MSSPETFARPGWTVALTAEPGEHFDLDRRLVRIHPGSDPFRALAHAAAHIDAGHWLCAPHGRFSPPQEREADEWADVLLALAGESAVRA